MRVNIVNELILNELKSIAKDGLSKIMEEREIKDIAKVIRSFENRGILLKRTSEKKIWGMQLDNK